MTTQTPHYEIQNDASGSFRVTDKETDSRIATCFIRENADFIVAALNENAALHAQLEAAERALAERNEDAIRAMWAAVHVYGGTMRIPYALLARTDGVLQRQDDLEHNAVVYIAIDSALRGTNPAEQEKVKATQSSPPGVVPASAGPADVREAAAKICDDLAFAESCHDCYDDLQRAAPYRRAAKAIRAMPLPSAPEGK